MILSNEKLLKKDGKTPINDIKDYITGDTQEWVQDNVDKSENEIKLTFAVCMSKIRP